MQKEEAEEEPTSNSAMPRRKSQFQESMAALKIAGIVEQEEEEERQKQKEKMQPQQAQQQAREVRVQSQFAQSMRELRNAGAPSTPSQWPLECFF